jgi:hypothetical protein
VQGERQGTFVEGSRSVPILSNIDREHEEVSALAVGPVSHADVHNHLLLESRVQGLSFREFVDARGSSLILTEEEYHRLAELMCGLSCETEIGRTAVLVSSKAAFDATRTLATLVETLCEIKAFHDEQEARAWLAAKPKSAPSP